MNTLKDNFNYYIEHQTELVKKYNGRFLVLKDCEVVGDYDNERDAYFASVERYCLGNFIIQYCSEGSSAYTQTFVNDIAFENIL